MRLSSRSVLLLFLMLLALLATSCRLGDATTVPTRPAVVTAAAPVGPVSPTKTAPVRTATAAPTIPAGPVAWTLTILHTGDVRGDVLPCG
ncbi:MAG: hypothetical protein ACP5OO_05280 [Chloroflexia bacterium]